jgi:L-aspartate oxidase
MRQIETDVIVVGAGLAGLITALKLKPLKVVAITPTRLGDGASSAWAQGGIAAAIAKGDTPACHADDTSRVAGEIEDKETVSLVTSNAENAIEELIELGVAFDKTEDESFALTKEAAHSRRRILHCGGDQTGQEIMKALIRAVRAAPHIEILEEVSAYEFVAKDGQVSGVFAHGKTGTVVLHAPATVLASGGIGQLFSKSTNPAVACGTGLAMAARAGAIIADPEFVQFHPTAIDLDRDPLPLATEALRGEGATLIDRSGVRFMQRVHADAELAPRDVVARAIWRKQQAGGHVYLDATTAIGDEFDSKFPSVHAYCMEAGIDPAAQPIAVTPAAHYHMGGIRTDHQGRTSLKGLWACGEVACTGMHGANRLASNSLLEAVVFAKIVASDIQIGCHAAFDLTIPNQRTEMPIQSATSEVAMQTLRELMYTHVGLERTESGLEFVLHNIGELQQAAQPISFELLNFLTAAKFIVVGALLRTESRGGHFRADYPAANAKAERTYLTLQEVDTVASAIGAQNIEHRTHLNA